MSETSYSIRTKILFITLGISLVTIAAMVLLVLLFIKPRLEDKLEKRGVSIAHAIAPQCVNPLLSRNFFQLELFFRDFITMEGGVSNVDYIYATTVSGEVAAHSFGREFPSALRNDTRRIDAGGHGIAKFSDNDHEIIEISLPLLDGSLGRLHVGMSAALIRQDVNDILLSLIGIGSLYFASSLTLLFFFERWIVRPIFTIRSVSQQVKEGNIESRVSVQSRDEIGCLADDFNSMLDAMRQTKATLLHEKQLLADSEKRFRTIIHQSPISMAIVSMDGTIEYINDYAVETFGYRPEDIPHMNDWWRQAYPDEDYRQQVVAQWTALVEKAIAENRYIERDEYRVVCKDGSLKTMLIFGVLIADKVFVVFEDITLRKRAEEDIQRINSQLEEIVAERTAELSRINRDLSSFCYAISHELNAPVARLKGFSRMFQEVWTENPADAEFCVKRIEVASQDLERVIGSVLQLSRLSQSAFVLQSLNLSAIVRKIADALLQEHPERTVAFVIADDITVSGDAILLRLCLENLVNNAFKYTSRQADARIEFGRDEKTGALYVRDNGIGFDMSHSDKLFEPFVRLHREDEFAGSGIGLATVQRIIERHGGRIWADAAPGRGAAFYFTLGHS